MSGLLDDLSLEDIEKAYEEKLTKNVSYDIDQNVSRCIHQGDIQQLQLFCEFPKRTNTLKFSLVKIGNNERYDIRNWYDDGEKPGKGITLTHEELVKFRDGMQEFGFNSKLFKVRDSYIGGKVSAIIYDRICVLNEFYLNGVKWNKEVSIVDWGYGKKIDFRKWAADYSICGKGVAVSFGEAEEIVDYIWRL